MAGKFIQFLSALLGNRGMKILSLGLASIAWYAIREVISFEKEFTEVPIEIRVDEGWAILDRSENSVVVTFQGPREAVLDIDREQVKLTLDIRGSAELGSMFVDLKPEDIQAPRGVRPVRIEPSTLYLSLDQEGERNVAVKASIQGQLPDGYEVESAVCKPNTVQLFGPRLKLGEIEDVRTASIDLEGRLGSFKLRAPIASLSESWVARVDPAYVQVEVTIVERSALREFSDVRIKVLTDVAGKARVSFSRTNAMVVVQGQSEMLETLNQQSIQAYVDCEALVVPSTNQIPIRVHAPQGVTVKKVDPQDITVTTMEI